MINYLLERGSHKKTKKHAIITLTIWWSTFVVVFLICRPLWTNNICKICWKDSCSSPYPSPQKFKLAYIHPCPQRGIWGSSLELILYMRNVSSRDNLHNLTCEAENRAGMGEAVVQLDIECMWWNFLFFNFHHFSHLESCYFSRENQVVLLKCLPACLKSELVSAYE